MKLWQKEEENVRGDEVAENLGGVLVVRRGTR